MIKISRISAIARFGLANPNRLAGFVNPAGALCGNLGYDKNYPYQRNQANHDYQRFRLWDKSY